jgi:hypothetical protein
MDFLMPGEGAASVVDSAEEMFAAEDQMMLETRNTGVSSDTVKLVFPLRTGEIGLDYNWPWNLCGGLIGGTSGNRFCTKVIKNPYHPHCGIASHAAHEAELYDGHGYIPSMRGRANTEAVFLEPNVTATRFPNKFNDIIGQTLSHEEWIAFLTFLPWEETLDESLKNEGQELTAEAVEKSKLQVPFAITPAIKKPRHTTLVSSILNSRSSKNLETRFREEGKATGKVELSFEKLEAPKGEEWVKEDEAAVFFPSTAQ